MLGELVPCGGGDTIPLMRPKLVVGRKSFCDITIPLANISSQHCELELKDGHWFVRDLGSTNGIRVDGQPCASDWLMPSDELTIANQRYTIRYAPPADKPPPKQSKSGPQFAGSLAERAGIVEQKTSDRVEWDDVEEEGSLGSLVPVGGGAPIALLKPKLVLGRHGSCDIALPDPKVSARHCELEFIGGHWQVRDLGSRNGTLVDGEKCESKWLAPGNVLALAKNRYKIRYTPSSDAPPADEGKASLSRSLLDKAGLLRKKK